MTFLLEGATANTVGDSVKADGGNKTLAVWGTDFDSGTVKIYGSPDNGGTWILLQLINGSDASFGADTIKMIDRLGEGMLIRATLTGVVSAAVDVNAQIFQ